MKLKIKIIMRDSSIITKTIKNPDKYFTIKYRLNKEIVERKYEFVRECVFIEKTLFGTSHILFYKEGDIKPLKTTFNNDIVKNSEISDIISSDLFKQLVNSTKTPDLSKFVGIGFIVILVIVGALIVFKQMS